MDLDFSNLNWVDTCESITSATSTIQHCFSSAIAFNQIILVTLLFVLIVAIIIKIIHKI